MKKDPARLLRRALRANAAFSAATGGLLIALPGRWAAVFGPPYPAAYAALGSALLAFAAVVAWASRDIARRRTLVGAIVAADGLWVLATPVVMAGGRAAIGGTGHALLAGTGAAVAILAGLQWHGLRASRSRAAAQE